MTEHTRQHVLKSCLLLVVVYIAARSAGWIGPHATVQFEPRLLWPGIALITAWGISRLNARKQP